MSTKTRVWFLVVAVLLALLLEVVGRAISGGEKTFLRVATVLRTNSFVLSRVGSPVATVARDGGPRRSALEKNGRRHGFDSLKVAGATGSESLKVYWCESAGGLMEVYAIYRTKPWAQDELVWGAPRPALH